MVFCGEAYASGTLTLSPITTQGLGIHEICTPFALKHTFKEMKIKQKFSEKKNTVYLVIFLLEEPVTLTRIQFLGKLDVEKI